MGEFIEEPGTMYSSQDIRAAVVAGQWVQFQASINPVENPQYKPLYF